MGEADCGGDSKAERTGDPDCGGEIMAGRNGDAEFGDENIGGRTPEIDDGIDGPLREGRKLAGCILTGVPGVGEPPMLIALIPCTGPGGEGCAIPRPMNAEPRPFGMAPVVANADAEATLGTPEIVKRIDIKDQLEKRCTSN
jgi:hypothetical protein